MSKNEKFDFSREEDQKRFEQLPKEEKSKEIASAQQQFNFMLQKVQSGEVKNYMEAEGKYEEEKEELQNRLKTKLSSFHLDHKWIKDVQKIIDFAKRNNIELDWQQVYQKGLEYRLNNNRINIELHYQQLSYKKRLEFYYNDNDIIDIKGFIYSAKENKAELDFSTPEIKQACQKRLNFFLSKGDYIQDIVNFAKENDIELDLQQACQKALEDHLIDDHFENAEYIINVAKKNDIELDLQQACQKALEYRLIHNRIEKAGRIINFAKENKVKLDWQQACQKVLEYRLVHDRIERVREIINFAKKNDIELDLQQACQKGLGDCLSKGYIDSTQQIINFAEENNIELDFSTTEVKQACLNEVKNCLSKGDISKVQQIINFAKENNIDIQSVIHNIENKFIEDPALFQKNFSNVRKMYQAKIGFNFSRPEVSLIKDYLDSAITGKEGDNILNNPDLKTRFEEEILKPKAKNKELIKFLSKEVWSEEENEYYQVLLDTIGKDKSARYIEISRQNNANFSAHDALYFLPDLVNKFANDKPRLANIINSINNGMEFSDFAKNCNSYNEKKAKELNEGKLPDNFKEFNRICVLIRKDFKFSENTSEEVKAKIALILDVIGNTEKLSDDLMKKNSRLMKLLENVDGFDEKAILQPTAPIYMRVKPLSELLRDIVGTRENNKLKDSANQLFKNLKPFLIDLQKKSVEAEKKRLYLENQKTYELEDSNVELIQLKKEHSNYLDNLKLIANGTLETGANVENKLKQLIATQPGYEKASPEKKINFEYQVLFPIYKKVTELLLKPNLTNTVKSLPILDSLVKEISESDEEKLVKTEGETDSAYREKLNEYFFKVIARFLFVQEQVQRLGNGGKILSEIDKQFKNQFKDQKVDIKNLLQKPQELEQFLKDNAPANELIESILQKQKISIGETLTARVRAKSDPFTLIAGDATNCCMPYGAEKTYEYIYRKDTASFDICIEVDGTETIIAQSVLVASRSEDFKSKDAKDFNAVAFDNIEITHGYEKMVPDIAKLYKKFIDEMYQDKTILMGTDNNDDRELVRGMGHEVSGDEFDPVDGEFKEWSDCFGNDRMIVLRDPKGKEKNIGKYQSKFVTLDMFRLDNPLRSQLEASFNLREKSRNSESKQIDEITNYLADTNRMAYRDEDDDPIWQAENSSSQIMSSGEPALLVIATKPEPENHEEKSETIIHFIKAHKKTKPEDTIKSLEKYLGLRSKDNEKLFIKKELLDELAISKDKLQEIAKKTGYEKLEKINDGYVLVGFEVEDEEDYEDEQGYEDEEDYEDEE